MTYTQLIKTAVNYTKEYKGQVTGTPTVQPLTKNTLLEQLMWNGGIPKALSLKVHINNGTPAKPVKELKAEVKPPAPSTPSWHYGSQQPNYILPAIGTLLPGIVTYAAMDKSPWYWRLLTALAVAGTGGYITHKMVNS